MANYISDREFTDYIHRHVAIPNVYNDLGWHEVNREREIAEAADRDEGIDYVFRQGNNYWTVQERFRDIGYRNYSDFTIRYRRDGNFHPERVRSEFYKIKADYFLYGITNCNKNELITCTDFLKYALIDLRIIYELIETGRIIIMDNNQNRCFISDGIMICPIKWNKDGSSNFFPIDIPLIARQFDETMILSQQGFY